MAPHNTKPGKPKKIIQPSLLRIPEEILKSTSGAAAPQSKSILLSVSDEILLSVSSHLRLVDSACLALTCKKTATFYATPHKTVSQKKAKLETKSPSGKLLTTLRLRSGEEAQRLDHLDYCECFSDESEWEDHIVTMEERFSYRLDGKVLADFRRRLDEGWNNSNSRFCHSCTKFVSTTEEFWEKKMAYWLYLDTGKTGTNFRQVADCEEHEGDEDAVVETWIKHGKSEVELKAGERFQASRYAGFRYLECPTCIFSTDRAAWCECSDFYFETCCSCPLNRDRM